MNGLGLPSAKRVSLLVMWAFIEHAQMFFCLPRVGPPVLVAVFGPGGRGGKPEGEGAVGAGGAREGGGGPTPPRPGVPGGVGAPPLGGAEDPMSAHHPILVVGVARAGVV